MIFVDASAIVAMVTREPDADDLRERLESEPLRMTSSIAVFEAAIAVARKRSIPIPDAQHFVLRFVGEAEIVWFGVGQAEVGVALDAANRFGKGRHPAKLNMGDCFAYACARTQGARLLFKGDDLGQTDIEAA